MSLMPLLGAFACADGVRAVVDGPSDRATKIEEAGDAIAARFTNPEAELDTMPTEAFHREPDIEVIYRPF